MALITKIGGVESDSFVTVAEADVIVPTLPDDPSAWEDLETAEKEYRLQLAAQLMGVLMLRGRKVYCGQGLCFPRSSQPQVHMIPDEVKETQVFVAYSVVHRALENRPESVTEQAAGSRVTRVSLGGLLSVGFSGEPISAGSYMDKMVRTTQFPAFLKMKRWLTQVRGGQPTTEELPCSTTTTTTSTTSTTVTTTTTT